MSMTSIKHRQLSAIVNVEFIAYWLMLARCGRKDLTRATWSQLGLATASREHPRRPLSSTYRLWSGSHDRTQRGQGWRRTVLYGAVIASGTGAGVAFYSKENRVDGFTTFTLTKKEAVSPTAAIFHLEANNASKDYQVYQAAWKKGIWNLQIKQPQIQVVRAYTPLPPVGDAASQEQLRCLIRSEMHGEVSGWLHRLPLGSQIEMRGPNLEYEISPETQHVVFLAGGTGIASALQAAHALLSHSPGLAHENQPIPHISILWANRKRDDCVGGLSSGVLSRSSSSSRSWKSWLYSPEAVESAANEEKSPIVWELRALQRAHPGQVTVDYFVDAENAFIDKVAVTSVISRLGVENTEIIISGPEGFVKYLGGSKEWQNGREVQGPLQGVVAQALKAQAKAVKVWKV